MLERTRALDAELDLSEQLVRSRVRARLLGEPQTKIRLGRFEIVRCLGQGGCGAVYEAREEGTPAPLALKCLHGQARAQFTDLQREFRAARNLFHRNLVTLYELFAGDQPFFTMELVCGATILAWLAERRADADIIRDTFAALLDAVMTIHAAGKVHRDLKPSNVLVSDAGRVVVLDYGLMIEHGPLVCAGLIGTRSYMAPEQLRSGQAGPAADVYACGKMLAEALSVTAAAAHDSLHGLAQLAAHMQAEQPAQRPSAELALARLRGDPLGTRSARVAQLGREPFVGRERELEKIAGALARTRNGQTAVLWVRGESGIGKSALLREAGKRARAAGATVFEGRCYERESSAFKVFEPVVSGLARWLGSGSTAWREPLAPRDMRALEQLFPALARSVERCEQAADIDASDPAVTQQRAATALHALLSQLASERPLVIAIDDLQWGDTDSARLMLSLLSLQLPPGLLFVGAYRDGESESSPFLRRVLRPLCVQLGDSGVEDLLLQGLAEDEVQALASSFGHAQASRSEQARALLQPARGVPFFLAELLSSFERADASSMSLEQRLLARVSACSPGAQRLLEILCIAGRPLPLLVASMAAEIQDTWVCANELCARRLARWRECDDGRDLEPYHDIVRGLIGPHAQGSARIALHRRLAQAVALLCERELELSLSHWLQAGERREARTCALRAAVQARQTMAWARSAELYRLAIELSDERDGSVAGLYEALAQALLNAGEHSAAGEAYERAAGQSQAELARALSRCAATQLLLGGQVERGITQISEALVAVGIPFPRRASAAYAMWWSGRAQYSLQRARGRLPRARYGGDSERCETLRAAYRGLLVHDPLRGGALHTLYLVASHGRGDEHELEALAWEAGRLAITEGPRARRAVLHLRARVATIARTLDEPLLRAIAQLLEASFLLHCCEQPRAALVHLRNAEQLLASCPGTHFERGWLAALRDYAVYTSAEVDLHTYWLTRVRDARQREDAYTHRQILFAEPLLHLLEDHPERALTFLERHWPQHTAPTDLFAFIALSARLDALHYRGDAASAYHLLHVISRKLALRILPTFVANHLVFLRARNAVALYAQTRRPALAREARRHTRARTSYPRLMQGLLRALHGCLALVDGDTTSAHNLLNAACAELVDVQHDNLAWSARYRLAQLDGDVAALARAQAYLHARGVRAPEAWVSMLLPVGTATGDPGAPGP